MRGVIPILPTTFTASGDLDLESQTRAVDFVIDAGVSDEEAHVYSESVRRGGTLVSARVPDEDASRIQAILDRFKPIDPALRGAEYRKEGWTTFDPKAPAYRPSEAEIERMRRESELT